jgi:TetR/AcrR family transcriptional repressor of nem operon
MPRLKSFKQEDAVAKAMELFWEKGYESTSLTDLTQHLGIGKGSFYATFKSKENLFSLCIETYTESNFPFLDKALETAGDFKSALQKLLVAYVDGLLNDPKRKGCLMANSCSLVGHSNSELAEKIAQHYHKIGAYFQHYFIRNGVEQQKAKVVADTIITFLIGASQQSKVNGNRDSYLSSIQSIINLFD